MYTSISLIILSFFLVLKDHGNPDYSKMNYWAAHPSTKDFADAVPINSNWSDNQEIAEADVFFIHPTTFYRRYKSNGPLNDRYLNHFTDKNSIRMNASVFNGSAKVYAPRYRQAALYNFFKRDSEKSQRAYDLAYSDIKAAFEYYLENENNGRPIIIAGHSQGSFHGQRLLKEYFEGKPLEDQLVAAYLIGYNINQNSFFSIEICNNPSDINCVVSYNSYGKGSRSKVDEYANAICVNPVSWKNDDQYVHANDHLGGVGKDFKNIDEKLLSCQCQNGVLWIENLRKKNYPVLGNKNYHLSEYLLFYASIRENIKNRVSSFLER